MNTKFCFHQSNQLGYIDLSGKIEFVQLFTECTFSGLIHVKVLNLSNNGISSVFRNNLLGVPNLQVMNMSSNHITFNDTRFLSLSSNRNIQILNFAHYLINFVPQNLFSDLVSL